MAKLCFVCDSLCVLLLIFLRITHILTIDDSMNGTYLYCFDCTAKNRNALSARVHELSMKPTFDRQYYDAPIHHRSEHSLVLELIDNQDVQMQKRDVPNTQPQITDNKSNPEVPPIPPPHLSNNVTATTNSTTEKIPTIPSKNKSGKLTKSALPVNITMKVPLLKQPIKNLGENGSGIRHNITDYTLKPILMQPQLIPHHPHDDDSLIGVGKNNQTGGDGADVAIVTDADFNKTLANHNITKTKTDSHVFYNSTFNVNEQVGNHFWVDMTNRSDVKVNDLLSKSHRRAATVTLSFNFPFYGHYIKNVTIATGGFLYTGDYVHSWLAATQYIAPLMANFDTSISNDSYIKYVDNGTAFTVEWEKVTLQDKPSEGHFTFQATLHKNGDIVFVYKSVPVIIENIQDDHHPVKVGLSDAYIIDRTVYFIRRKTIYEYHRVNFYKQDIKNWTVIYLSALPTCLNNEDCHSCLTNDIPNFTCMWCPSINKCSSGTDRNRQVWLTRGCDRRNFSNEALCLHFKPEEIFDKTDLTYTHDANKLPNMERASLSGYQNVMPSPEPVGMGMSGVVAVVFLIAMVAGLGAWIMYAYRNPHTTSGQILIKYRPTQWRWRRGEARYTAATIHM